MRQILRHALEARRGHHLADTIQGAAIRGVFEVFEQGAVPDLDGWIHPRRGSPKLFDVGAAVEPAVDQHVA